MDNITGGSPTFLKGFWEFGKVALITIGVLFLLIALVMRRPGKAFAVLVLGGYATLAWYFMTVYKDLGYDVGIAMGGVVLGSLGVLTIF